MNATLQRAFEVMLEASSSATILALIIAAVQWALRGRLSPAWRFALWTPVLLRLFLPIFPESSFSLFNAPRWYASWTGAAAPAPGKSPFVGTPEPTAFDTSMLQEWSEAPEAASLRTDAALPVPAVTAEHIRSTAAIFWTFGALLFLARLSLGTAWLSWRTRKTVSPPNSRLNELLNEAARTIACTSRPRLNETNLVESPALFGLWRPVLLLPVGFSERLSETEIRHVFLHELAHLKRRDLLLNWLMALAQALHWFNPVVWLIFRRMRLERELACDEMALRACQVSDPKAYGETILRLLEGVSTRPALSALVGIAEEKHSAKQRLQQIASFRSGKRKYWIAVPVLIGLVLVGLTNAQAPKKVEDVAQESNEQKSLETEADPRSSFRKDEAVIRFDVLQLEGKTLTEALQILRAEFPDDLRDIRFNWYQTTNITSGPDGTYSANAIGYITTEIGTLPTPADELRLSREALSKGLKSSLRVGPFFEQNANMERGGEVGSALELIVSATEKWVRCSIQEDTVTFSLEPKLVTLIQDGRTLMEMGNLSEATRKFDEALKIDPDSRAAKYYLNLGQERALSQQAPDREPSAKAIHPVITNNEGITTDLPQLRLRDVSRHEPSGTSKRIGFDWYSGNVLLAKDKVSLSDADRTNDTVAATSPRRWNAVEPVSGFQTTDLLRDPNSELPQANSTEPHPVTADDHPRFSNGLRYDRNPTQVEFRYSNRVYSSAGRQAIVKRLHEIVFPIYDVADLPLKEVIKDLAHTARQRDPEKAGVNFVFSSLKATEPSSPDQSKPAPKVDDFRVTISPPLRNVRLVDVLNAITHVAVPPAGADPTLRIRYTVEDYAVVFIHGGEEPEPLYTRSYKVDPNTFVHGLDRVGVARQGGGGIVGVTLTNLTAEIQVAVRNFFGAAGIDFSTNSQSNPPADGRPVAPQKAIFFNDRTGMLLVRATLRDLDIVENALQILTLTPPQLTLEAQAIPLQRDEEIGIIVAMLQTLQKGKFRPALTDVEFRRFKVNQPMMIPADHRVTTLTGRPARMSLNENYVFDVRCDYAERNDSFKIEVTARDLEEKQEPLIRRGAIYDGQTFIVLPRKGDPAPKYILFITATLIDAAGNRISNPDQNPDANERTPPQNVIEY